MSWKASLRKSVLVFVLALMSCVMAAAQEHAPGSLPVVMMSDIHFDPFHDPAKFAQLLSGPASDWAKILNGPDSPTQAADFASLQQKCHAHDSDTDWRLFSSSLQAAHGRQAAPLFVTVSGDLLAHQFDCRFRTLAPGTDSSAYGAFAEKTVAFVALELRLAFPKVPIYFALGNNDSGCGDYRESPDSEFLRNVAQVFADSVDGRNRATVLSEFPEAGNYDLSLPKPMERTRLIVLQDIFQSYRYKACSGPADPDAAKKQIAWLAAHLAEARQRGEHVWVMAHIPPGVNGFATFQEARDVCGGDPPAMFLSSEALADTLVKFPDVVRLVVSAHTHMDEIRLLEPGDGAGKRGSQDAIPAKLVPSITPVHGNDPAFLVAAVDAASAVLKDYSVFAASNRTGVGTEWRREYTFSEAYGLPDFSASSVQRLVAGFAADGKGTSAMSSDYQRWFFAGDNGVRSAGLQHMWPSYVCGMSEDHEADFRRCVCGGSAVHP